MFKTKYMQLMLQKCRLEQNKIDTVRPTAAIPHITTNVNTKAYKSFNNISHNNKRQHKSVQQVLEQHLA